MSAMSMWSHLFAVDDRLQADRASRVMTCFGWLADVPLATSGLLSKVRVYRSLVEVELAVVRGRGSLRIIKGLHCTTRAGDAE